MRRLNDGLYMGAIVIPACAGIFIQSASNNEKAISVHDGIIAKLVKQRIIIMYLHYYHQSF